MKFSSKDGDLDVIFNNRMTLTNPVNNACQKLHNETVYKTVDTC